ncbi:hypothetical protein ACP70R_025181 [Stipagrostis hirtigluma subsp. patula]
MRKAVRVAPVVVWSLRQAQADAARNRGAAAVTVRAVEVSHAPALLALLRHQRKVKGWNVAWGLLSLRALARIDILLTLGIDAHLATVADNIYTASYLVALRDWTWAVQTPAPANVVGVKFARKVTHVCNDVRRFVVHAFNRSRREVWLHAKVPELVSRLRDLKSQVAIVQRAA